MFSKNNAFHFFFKLLSFIIPFYMVYDGRLYEHYESNETKARWRFILAGFAFYISLVILYILSK